MNKYLQLVAGVSSLDSHVSIMGLSRKQCHGVNPNTVYLGLCFANLTSTLPAVVIKGHHMESDIFRLHTWESNGWKTC